MARVLLTKNELKKQRDALKLFSRYLPTLQLKKQQLATVIRRIGEELDQKKETQRKMLDETNEWIAVMAEPVSFEEYVTLRTVDIGYTTVAGVLIPVLQSVQFETTIYDLFTTPYWLDTAVRVAKALKSLNLEIETLQQQFNLIKEELKITTQRVNLFERVKIPEAKDTIRRIQIVLADQQTASVVRGKISKRKMARV